MWWSARWKCWPGSFPGKASLWAITGASCCGRRWATPWVGRCSWRSSSTAMPAGPCRNRRNRSSLSVDRLKLAHSWSFIMPDAPAPYGRITQKEPLVKEVHVLWSPDGLGCDGDTISVTAATQPSIEDIVLGAIPGLPKVHLHNRVLDYSQGGDDYMKVWHDAAEDRLDAPFVLVIEGSIPNEAIKEEGYWAAMGNDRNGNPITLNAWIDRLAPRAFAIVAAGTCAAYGGIHAMAGNPTGCMGLADYLGWGFRTKTGLPVVNVPGCPVQPDNMTETLLYLLYQAAGLAPMIPLDEQLRPTWLFGKTVHEGCDRAGYYEQADFAHEYGSPKCLVKIGCWGPVVNCNVTKRGWMDGIGGC